MVESPPPSAATVLLADDEPGVRRVLDLVLRDLGHRVLLAADGVEALAMHARHRPDVVITDLRMPGLGGLDLLAAIKGRDRDTEVILVTGHGDMEQSIRGLRLGAADFIQKPVDGEVLDIAIRRALERQHLRRSMAEHARHLEQLAATQARRLLELEQHAAARQVAEGFAAALCGLAEDPSCADTGLSLFHELPCLVAIHDREGRLVSANALHRQRLGDSPPGRPGWEVYQDGETRREALPVFQTLAQGQPRHLRETMRDAQGVPFAVLVHTAPVRDRDGQVALVLELAVDIEESRRLRQELDTAQAHLASLGLLVASLSHGIKGLLTALDGAVYTVDAGFVRGDEARVQRGWSQTKQLMGRVKGLVLDILFCAKRREAQRQDVDLAAYARELVELIQPKADAAGVALRLEAPADAGTFPLDPSLLTGALVNLLENAVEACRQETTRPNHAVILRLGREGETLRLEVADDGMGMDEATRSRLFQVFFSTKGSQGTGLGLFIARHAVAGHGGRIEAASVKGEGSRFVITLPPGETGDEKAGESTSGEGAGNAPGTVRGV